MKKTLLSATLTLATFAMQAQPMLNDVAVYDDFSTQTEYSPDAQGTRGIYWWVTPGKQVITRDFENKQLDVSMSQVAYQYIPFGVGFGTTAGKPNTIDLSGDGTWSFDIENTGKEGLSMRVACQDDSNKLVDCAPTPAGMAFDPIWKYQTQILIPVGQKVTFKAGTPNGAGGGINNNCDFANGVWGDYGTPTYPHIGSKIRRDCNLAKIKGINITVLSSEKNNVNQHALSLINGLFSISNFRVGAAGSAGTEEYSKKKQLMLYPNPANSSLTIQGEGQVQITTILGQVIYRNAINNSITIDLSTFDAGIYFVDNGHQIQKLAIEK